jgi:hypothetical protein
MRIMSSRVAKLDAWQVYAMSVKGQIVPLPIEQRRRIHRERVSQLMGMMAAA